MRLLQALGLIAFLAAGAATGVIASTAQAASLAGKVLVAHEGMPDPRFQETVIYLIDHDANGAFGLVVNKPTAFGPIATLLEQLGIDADEYGFDLQGSVTLHYGGPVDPGRGFVLHSADYEIDGTRNLSRGIALTINPEALIDIAIGQGPRRSLIIFGYSGWGPSQLEGELARGDWKVIDADADLVLGTDHEDKWRRALQGLMIIRTTGPRSRCNVSPRFVRTWPPGPPPPVPPPKAEGERKPAPPVSPSPPLGAERAGPGGGIFGAALLGSCSRGGWS